MRRTWQTDNANVVREVFTAKLRARPSFWASSSSSCSSWTSRNADHVRSLPSAVHRNSERLLTDGFQVGFRRRTANHKRDMVRGQAAVPRVRIFSTRKFFSLRESAGLWFPGRDTFCWQSRRFRNAKEFVLIAIYRVQVDLRGRLVPVLTSLYMSSAAFCECAGYLRYRCYRRLSTALLHHAAGPHALAFFTDDDRGAGILQVGSTPLAAISEFLKNCSASTCRFRWLLDREE